MSSKTIPLAFARCLLQLVGGEVVSASAFAQKKLLQRFVEDGMIEKRMVSARRFNYGCSNPQRLLNYLEQQYGILSLDSYVTNFEAGEKDGVTSLEAVTSTKTFRTQSMQGFFIKSYNANVMMKGEVLPTVPEGVELFVVDYQEFSVSPQTVVVGIENPECFRKINQLRHYFSFESVVFVMRYHSISPVKWLMTIPNSYIHFGDFDPAGIAIYYNEYCNPLGEERCTFFVPDQIQLLLDKYGSRALFDKQARDLPAKALFDQPDLQELIELLQTTGKGLEQERLLSL